jgi:hypothetical protein
MYDDYTLTTGGAEQDLEGLFYSRGPTGIFEKAIGYPLPNLQPNKHEQF